MKSGALPRAVGVAGRPDHQRLRVGACGRPVVGRHRRDHGNPIAPRRRTRSGWCATDSSRPTAPASSKRWTSAWRRRAASCCFLPTPTCTVPPTWVERLTEYFTADAGDNTGVVFGQVGVRGPDPAPDRFTDRYQDFDQPLVHQYSTASAGLGQPTGCFGNNWRCARRCWPRSAASARLATPLPRMPRSSARPAGPGWKVRASTLAATLITTEPQPNWRAFINQHVRWNGGAFFSNDRAAAWGYRYVTLFLILSVAVAPGALLAPWLLVWPLTSLVSIGTLAAWRRCCTTAATPRPGPAGTLYAVLHGVLRVHHRASYRRGTRGVERIAVASDACAGNAEHRFACLMK